MKFEIEVPEDSIRRAIDDSIRRNDWRREISIRADAIIRSEVEKLSLDEPVRVALQRLADEVIENSIRERLRYVVKLAVDRELAIARMAEQIKAEEVAP